MADPQSPPRWPWLLVLGVLLAGGVGWWWWSQPRTDEDRVRAAIEQVAAGARDADLARTLEPISRGYRSEDAEGGVGYDEVRSWLFLQFQKRGPVSILLGPIQVEVDGERARARFDATVAEFDRERLTLLPDNADAFHFEVDLAREEGEWRVVGHSRRAWSDQRPSGP